MSVRALAFDIDPDPFSPILERFFPQIEGDSGPEDEEDDEEDEDE